MKATFHERQYELAVNLELIAGSGGFFAPMQVIEENVGYDIALIPGHAVVWTQLGVGRPRGVQTPVAYDATLNPIPGGQSFAASLFIQYKRAERMKRRSAKEAVARASQGGGVPFFRVRLDDDQHGVLTELEQRVGSDAVVRYCAPLFHQIEELWVRQSTQQVFADSTFIAPSQAGSPPACWTYDGQGTSIFCSDPRRGESERQSDLLRALVRTGLRPERPRIELHLRTLASEIARIDLTSPRRRRGIDEFEDETRSRPVDETRRVPPPLERSEWFARLRAAAPERPEAEIASGVDAAVVANAAASIGLTWLLAEIQPLSTSDM